MGQCRSVIAGKSVAQGKVPIVSIVLPIFNGGATLAAALTSVAHQAAHVQGIELIGVDNGSTDGSPDLARRWQWPTGVRAKLIEERTPGVAAARNTGLRAAEGEFIAFLDQDDEWPRGYLLAHLTVLRHGGFDLSFAHLVVKDSAGVCPSSVPERPKERLLHLRDNPFVPSQVIVSRHALNAVGLFDESLSGSDDWDLFVRIAFEPAVAMSNVGANTYALYHDHSGAQHRDIVRVALAERGVLNKHLHRLSPPAKRSAIAAALQRSVRAMIAYGVVGDLSAVYGVWQPFVREHLTAGEWMRWRGAFMVGALVPPALFWWAVRLKRSAQRRTSSAVCGGYSGQRSRSPRF